MSILDEVNERCRDGSLVRLLPPMVSPLRQKGRLLYVSMEIHNWLVGPWPGGATQERRWKRLRADLEAFVEGKLITLSQDRDRAPVVASDMAQLKPFNEEVWEFRLRRPKPPVRVFGRFAGKDFFVALTWEYRQDLGGFDSEEWREAKHRCITEWALRLNHQPWMGSYPDDYISNFYLV